MKSVRHSQFGTKGPPAPFVPNWLCRTNFILLQVQVSVMSVVLSVSGSCLNDSRC